MSVVDRIDHRFRLQWYIKQTFKLFRIIRKKRKEKIACRILIVNGCIVRSGNVLPLQKRKSGDAIGNRIKRSTNPVKSRSKVFNKKAPANNTFCCKPIESVVVMIGLKVNGSA